MARAYVGVFALLFAAWLCSEDRRRIRWRTVAGGLLLQLAAALVLIGIPGANRAMFWLNDAASALQTATETGTYVVCGTGSTWYVVAFRTDPLAAHVTP